MPDFQSILDAFNAAPTRHAMFVHFPIVLSIVGAMLALLAAILRSNITLRVLAIILQAVLVVAVLATVNSGEHANDAIQKVLTPEVYELIAKHEDMAERTWLIAVGTLLALLLSASLKRAAGAAFAWLAVLVAMGGAGWVGMTAHHGGELVYTFGVGTPQPVACIDIPGTHIDGRDHAAEHAAQQQPQQGAATMAESRGGDATSGNSAPVDPNVSDNPVDAAKIAFFRDEAFPILSEFCFNCHNAARVTRGKSGGLDQTSLAALLKGGDNGPSIVVGNPEESLLIHRMRGDNIDFEIMPPDGRLTDQQIAVIEQWIRDGAVWPADL